MIFNLPEERRQDFGIALGPARYGGLLYLLPCELFIVQHVRAGAIGCGCMRGEVVVVDQVGVPEVFVGGLVFADCLTTLLREVPQGQILNLLDGVRRGVLQGHSKVFSI